MTKEDVKRTVTKVFVEHFGEEQLQRLEKEPKMFESAGTGFLNSGLDSLDKIEFVMALEEEFTIDIDDALLTTVHTLDDAVNAVHTLVSDPLHVDL